MKYKIFGGQMPAVTVRLEAGESVYTQSGGMSWMTEGVTMDTNLKGGLGKSLGRLFSGESLFIATYTAQKEADITFAASLPGEIRPFRIAPGQEYIAQKGAFLCATPNVHLSAFVTGVKTGLFGGEGFVLQRIAGQGMAFLELDGAVQEVELQAGEKIIVDTGNVALFEAQVGYEAKMVKGFKNILFGGEGLFLTTLTGPGKVWLQTLTASEIARRVIPYIPTSSN